MMDLLDRNRAELGVDTTDLPDAIANARGMLATAADLELVEANRDGNQLNIQLRVVNLSGHQLPTSFPSRRVWLHLTVETGAGIVFESGRLNADGSIVGASGDNDPATFEPHYDLITTADQVQIYEPVMGNTDGEVTHTLLRAGTYLKDNRLTPSGFIKAQAPADVAVAGGAAQDADFDNGSDLITYSITVPGSGPVEVVARLNYQALSQPFLEDLFTDDDLPEVARFHQLYEDQAIRVETVAELTANL